MFKTAWAACNFKRRKKKMKIIQTTGSLDSVIEDKVTAKHEVMWYIYIVGVVLIDTVVLQTSLISSVGSMVAP